MKGIIFDLDGTLVNTLLDIGGAMNRVIERHGRTPHPIDAYRTFVGGGARNLVRLSYGSEEESEIDEILSEYRVEYADNLIVDSKPYDGVVDLLERLKASGYKLALLSNKPDDDTVTITEHFFPGTFDVVRGNRKGEPVKPDPFVGLAVAGELAIEPHELVMVGDSGSDMRFAVNTGMIPIGVSWGFRQVDELIAGGARYIADDSRELEEILRGIER